jgi:hypothetical protein
MDSFLFVFTALPIRAAIALYHLILRHRKLHAIQKVDILKVIILVLGYLFLRLLDIPRYSAILPVACQLAINSFTTCVCAQFVVLHGQGVAVEDQVSCDASCGTYSNLLDRSHCTVTNLALAKGDGSADEQLRPKHSGQSLLGREPAGQQGSYNNYLYIYINLFIFYFIW